ncbi:MAG: hypothetical protein IKZ52_09190 [Bacteroidales bacterium]|nr:hypothetical protein [Bacteroidales bacterium]
MSFFTNVFAILFCVSPLRGSGLVDFVLYEQGVRHTVHQFADEQGLRCATPRHLLVVWLPPLQVANNQRNRDALIVQHEEEFLIVLQMGKRGPVFSNWIFFIFALPMLFDKNLTSLQSLPEGFNRIPFKFFGL